METNLILKDRITKTEIEEISKTVIDKILSGEQDPLKIEINLKMMENIIKKIRSDDRVKTLMITEADNYPEKSFIVNGAKITKTQKTSYDYSDDSDWELYDQNKKEREKMLKRLTTEVIDPVSGEIIKPPKQSITRYLKIEVEE